jgi:hypothetical protein
MYIKRSFLRDKPGFPLLIEVMRNEEINIKLKYQTKYCDSLFIKIWKNIFL